MKGEIAQEVAKAAPPVTVTSWAWFHGVNVNEMVGWATLAYIVLQAAYLLWKWVRQLRRGK